MRPFSAFIFSILLLLAMIIESTEESQSLINSTCTKCAQEDPTISYAFCTGSLQAAHASRCATLQCLGSISIHLVRDNVTATRAYIRRLLRKGRRSDSYVDECLSDCLELFSEAVVDVKTAGKHFNARRYDDANVKMSAVLDAAVECEDGFKERQGVVSPLSKRNNDTLQLSAIALSVMHLIWV